MSDKVPGTEVFTDAESDQDGIVHAYGTESIDDRVEGPGDHDAVFDEWTDRDGEAGIDRLRDPVDPETSTDESTAADLANSAESGGTGPTVEVLPGDGQRIEALLELTGPDAGRTRARGGLVGPEPSSTRLSNDSFGGSTAEPTPGAEPGTTVFEWFSDGS